MKKRYDDCIHDRSICLDCALSNYNRDCHNNPCNQIAFLRTLNGMTQQQLANASGTNIRQVQRFENGERDILGASLKIAIAIASALGVDVKDIIDQRKDGGCE